MENNERVRSKASDDHVLPTNFESTVLAMLEGLKKGMQSMEYRVASLEDKETQSVSRSTESARGEDTEHEALSTREARSDYHTEVQSTRGGMPTPKVLSDARPPRVQSTQPATSSPAQEPQDSNLWADRVDVSMDYSVLPEWDNEPDEEETPEGKGIRLFKVSDKTEKFLSVYFSSAVPNQVRRQWRDKYGAPNTPATACPNMDMDKVIKGRLSAETKSHDRQLAKNQALLLDAVGPLTHILEEAAKGELTQKTALEAAQTALKLLGNASVHVNRERRKNALQNMNSRLVDMADDDIVYKCAAPALFGEGFCKRAKERDEELKCLNQAISSKSSSNTRVKQGSNFFPRGHSQRSYPRGGGQNYRGQRKGGYQRNHPYRANWIRNSDNQKKTYTI